MPTAVINDTTVYLANPEPVSEIRHFVGRQRELALCRAAWGIDTTGRRQASQLFRLHFRLQGPPGVGKNEIVYELVREQNQRSPVAFYMIQGHEEMTPEDLALVLVPEPQSSSSSRIPLVLRASPLATAIYEGGVFFFDEINRVPERALSPLASVLDSRQHLYSAMTGIHIKPKDEEARRRFRFCCALNPQVTESGRGVLPDYIEQRTLPSIDVGYPALEDLNSIIAANLNLPPESQLMADFARWYRQRDNQEVSVRQALSLMMFVMNHGMSPAEAEGAIFGRPPAEEDE
jgi:MoxR-like ATPase